MLDVLTIGTATRDTFLASAGIRVLRDPKHLAKLGFPTGEAECFALGAKIEVGEPISSVGGGAANAAVTFARQGFTTAALVRVGADESGDAVVRTLERETVRVRAVRDRKRATAASTILLTTGGERTVLVYRGASEGLARREVPWSALRARWAYVAPGGISVPLIIAMVSFLKRKGARVAMNPSRDFLRLGSARTRRLFGMLDVVIVNREEAALVTGAPYGDARGVFEQFRRLVSGIAVMTDGPRGSFVSDGSRRYEAEVFRERARRDRTGAGDAFGAGFVAGLVRTNDVPYAIRLAAANATSVVEQVGACTGALTRGQFRSARWRRLNLIVKSL